MRQHFADHQRRYIKLREGLDKWKDAEEAQRYFNDKAARNHVAGQPCGDDSLPATLVERTVGEDVQQHPERYLFVLWNMNKLFDWLGERMIAVLPLSTGFVPGASLHIDTQALEQLVGRSDPKAQPYFAAHDARLAADRVAGKKRAKPGRNSAVEALDEKDQLWRPFFDIDAVAPRSKVVRGTIRFGHHLTTDGISVSATVLHRGDEDEQKKKKARSKKSASMQPKKRMVNSADPNVDVSHLVGIDPSKIVGVDPGKIELVHLTNDTGEGDPAARTLRYTKQQRRHESGAARREAHQQRIRTPEVIEAEQLLANSTYHSRSPSLEAFQIYLYHRFMVQNVLYMHYADNAVHRIFRWNNWRGRRSSEDRFVQKVVDTFGADAVLAYGDSSGWHSIPGLAPTPTTGLTRRFAHRLEVIAVPEYKTSRTCSNCLAQVEGDPTRTRVYTDRETGLPKRVPVRTNVFTTACTLHLLRSADRLSPVVQVRGIRRCTSDECGGHKRWSRDHNAAVNIRANLLHRIAHPGHWHPSFTP